MLSATGIAAKALESEQSAYVTQVSSVVAHAVMDKLAEHPELLKGSMKFSFRLDPQGHQSDARVISSTSNRFVEQTTLRMIRASKFPPVPKRVIKEGGYKYIEIQCEWSLERPRANGLTIR